MDWQLVHAGFDGLDVAFQGRAPQGLIEALEGAQVEARERHQPVLLEWRGESFHVAETGALGGYAYRLDTGPEGAVWFVKRNQDRREWNLRVSVRSAMLVTRGFDGTQEEIYRFLEAIGADVLGESIGRVDYAIDFIDLSGGFALDPQNFVMHSHCNRQDHGDDISINGCSGRYTSVTIGKQPGRQIIVYDKTREIRARQKWEWLDIWGRSLLRAGLPPLAVGDTVWRVELRAGKQHLKERWGIVRWADLRERLADMFGDAMRAVRLTEPGGDSNRARWVNHPLWDAAKAVVVDGLWEWRSDVGPGVVKAVRRDALSRTMSAMIVGMLATWCLATGTEAKAAPVELQQIAQDYIKDNARDFRSKLSRAERKYYFVCQEGKNEGSVGINARGGVSNGASAAVDGYQDAGAGEVAAGMSDRHG